MKSLIATWVLSTMIIVGFTVPAFATSNENSGTVASFQLIPNKYYAVTLNGLNTLCPDRDFAYLGFSDNNLTAEVTAIQNAEAWGSTLYIYWTTDAQGNCHITRLYY